MPERKLVITLSVPAFLDTICQGCVARAMGKPENPKMGCKHRYNGEYCQRAMDIGLMICKRTSLENLTNFEDSI